jgi:Flp pilus assembly protein TadG
MRTTGILGNRRGNTLVESTLVFGAFMFMLIGTFDFGQFLFVHQTLVERARNAVRYATVNSAATTTEIQNMVLYNQTTVPTGRTIGDFGVTSAMVAVSNVTTDAAGNTSQSPGKKVVISGYPFTMFSPYVGGAKTGRTIVASLPKEY